jgi:hypothetical protein
MFALFVSKRFEELSRFEESLEWLDKVVDTIEASVQKDPNQPVLRDLLANLVQTRALSRFRLHQYALALKDWERRSQLTPVPLPPDLRVYIAGSLARVGEHVKAAAEAKGLEGAAEIVGENLYNLALALAISIPFARMDAKLTPAEREALAERYAKDAVAWLRKSHAAGFFQAPEALEQFKNDAGFRPFREREDFKQLLRDVEKQRQGAKRAGGG